MSNLSPVRVQLVGFTPSTRTLLKSTFSGYSRKGRSFVVDESGEAPSLYLLDSDDVTACENWRDSHLDFIDAPVVSVGKTLFDLNIPVMSKPLQWNKLYDTLLAAVDLPLPTWPESLRVKMLENAKTRTDFSALTNASGQKKKILVVDDSATVRHYMSIKLAPFGFVVDYAESGEAAVEKCKDDTYEIVFLDVVMTGIDGYDTCKMIRPLLPTGTPIVMVTTRDSPFDKMRGTLAGCSAYLVKPVDEHTVSDVMTKWLKIQPRR